MDKPTLYRCELCGKISRKQEDCCGRKMKDLASPECKTCGMCRH